MRIFTVMIWGAYSSSTTFSVRIKKDYLSDSLHRPQMYEHQCTQLSHQHRPLLACPQGATGDPQIGMFHYTSALHLHPVPELLQNHTLTPVGTRLSFLVLSSYSKYGNLSLFYCNISKLSVLTPKYQIS